MTRGADTPALVAVDWGTTRLRASLLDGSGRPLAEAQAESGVQSVPAGGFPAALDAVCGRWFADFPELPVIMAGMVGSRNGWVEAPYLACPCGPDEIAARLTRLAEGSRDIRVVPGVDIRWTDGGYDVMRGEETQALGSGVVDGLLCLPGTHCKWIEMAEGRICRFATFITGEFYAAMIQSFVGRLAGAPEDGPAGQAAAVRAAASDGGLLRHLFQARALVLGGDLPPGGVRPFLSRLIVEAEIDAAIGLFGRPDRIHLLAAEPQRRSYAAALAARGVEVVEQEPAAAMLAGVWRIRLAAAAAGENA
jgi:2-dehydro-3-deoxygalactonokinase